MNIGVDVRSLTNKNPAGVGEYTVRMLERLFEQDTGDQYFLFCNSLKHDVCLPDWDYPHVHVVQTRWPNKVFSLLSLLGLLKIDQFAAKRFGVTFDWWWAPNLHFTAVSRHVMFALTLHDLSFRLFPDCLSFRRKLWHWCVRPEKQVLRADKIFAVSENTKRDVVRLFGVEEENVEVVYPVLGDMLADHTECPATLKLRRTNYFLFLGTLEPRKNILGIIDAYGQLPEHIRCSHDLVIAGGKGWKCDDVLAAIDATAGVRYIGYVADADKAALYAGASVFVFPSLYEGFGYPPLEALACGTPVVVSNRSSLPEVVGDAARMVNPLNTADIARGMEELIGKQIEPFIFSKNQFIHFT